MRAEDGGPGVRLLGPVQFVGSDGTMIDLPSASQRRLLAVLALYAPGSVRSGFLCRVLDIAPVADANRLDEVRASAIEDLNEVRLTSGEPERAIQDLEVHIIEYPLRGRSHGLLMRALACTGRHAEALRVFRSRRAYLAETVGLEPGDDLREIEQRVADGWRGLDESEVDHERDRRSSDRRRAVLDDAIRSTVVGAPFQPLELIVGRVVDQLPMTRCMPTRRSTEAISSVCCPVTPQESQLRPPRPATTGPPAISLSTRWSTWCHGPHEVAPS